MRRSGGAASRMRATAWKRGPGGHGHMAGSVTTTDVMPATMRSGGMDRRAVLRHVRRL